jgi:hypothetical protein
MGAIAWRKCANAPVHPPRSFSYDTEKIIALVSAQTGIPASLAEILRTVADYSNPTFFTSKSLNSDSAFDSI